GNGVLNAIERFDRPGEQASVEKQIAVEGDALGKACGARIPLKVDWASVKDEVLLHYSISSYCGERLPALPSLCETEAGEEAVKASVKTMDCRCGAALNVETKAGTLTWTVSTEGSNLGEFAKTHLESSLGGGGPSGDSPFTDSSLKGRAYVEKTAVCTD